MDTTNRGRWSLARRVETKVPAPSSTEGVVLHSDLAPIEFRARGQRASTSRALVTLVEDGIRLHGRSFPVQLGRAFRLADELALGDAVFAATTLQVALQRRLRFARLTNGQDDATLSTDGKFARWTVKTPASASFGDLAVAEWNLVETLNLMRQATAEKLLPVEVSLASQPLDELEAFAAEFGVSPKLKADKTELVFPQTWLSLPIASDASGKIDEMRKVTDELATKDLLGRFAVSRVRAALLSMMHGELPSLAGVAKHLKLTERELAQQLAREGTSYQAVMDDVRLEAAVRYLDMPALAISEIAFLLGFSEVGAFQRLFKRWTGKSPEALRSIRVTAG